MLEKTHLIKPQLSKSNVEFEHELIQILNLNSGIMLVSVYNKR